MTTDHSLRGEGALFTTPLRLASLEDGDRACPICQELYVEPCRSNQSLPNGGAEWAVRVDMIAERSGIRRCCGHVLGRSCLEKHLHSGGPWRNKCPLCRNVWFQTTLFNDVTVNRQTQIQTSAERTVPQTTLRRSSRIASRALARRPSSNTQHASSRGGRTIIQPSSHAARSPHFTRRLLRLLEVETGSDEVKVTLEQIERTLRILYES
ncbi:hypothetical protein T440DRAFT_278386 [Plenodomus tracheiphilus IPT5]|uniref:RING-type domain-containing protein n=1 Tax=Plenodomus tracheiphilus IPT5 TaxID=1408161 RepID=A0A6A7ASU3_9PLEO|nr:hypothetical protein T440DRAFT_278386 [Plenodomus tracheiphilus IPT5]